MDAADLQGLSPELRFLCHGLRQCLGTCDPVALRAAAAAVTDWPAVVEGARRHRIVPLLARVAADPSLSVPPQIVRELGEGATANARASLLQAGEVARLAAAMAGGGVRLFVLKGILLSQELHGSLSARGVGDIDLLVEPAALWQADAILLAEGYVRLGPDLTDSHRRMGHCIHHLQYWHRPTAQFVELHQRLTANPTRLATDFERLWQARREMVLGGVRVATLPQDALASYLAIHGAHHCWERLRWILDVAVLLKEPEARQAARDEAMRTGTTLALDHGLGLAAALFALAAPEGAAGGGAGASRLRGLLREMYRESRWRELPGRGSLAWLRREVWRRSYLYSLKGSWREAWREILSDAVNPVDWDVLPLPRQLLWLYPVLRPLGWVLRNFRGKPPI